MEKSSRDLRRIHIKDPAEAAFHGCAVKVAFISVRRLFFFRRNIRIRLK